MTLGDVALVLGPSDGDGLAMAGIAVAVLAVIPAMVISAGLLFREGDRIYPVLALLGAAIIALAATGMLSVPG